MPHNNYDAIVVGAGHNGLTNATYLARSGLKVLLLERNPWIGGAAVSREIEKGWTYSNCSYVCSLLRPEIFRDLELARHGLQVVPYGGGVTITSKGDILGSYADHELKRREFARHNAHDGDAYDRYSTEVMRQCKFIRPLLLRTPPDPTSLRPRDIREMIFLSKEFKKLGEQVIYDTIRFYSMSIADYLAEFFDSDLIKAALSGSGIIGTALGPYSPGTAYVLLHHYMGDVDGSIGSWGFARGGMGAVSKALGNAFKSFGGEIITDADVKQVLVSGNRVTGVACANGNEYRAKIVVSNLDPKRTFTKLFDPKDLRPEFVKRAKNFKIRGSSGKLNIALDGLPGISGAGQGQPAALRRHALPRFAGEGRTRLRRLEERHLVEGAVPRPADSLDDRSDHDARRQALDERVRAVRAAEDPRPRLDRRGSQRLQEHGARHDRALQPQLQITDPPCRSAHPGHHRERGGPHRGQHLPGRSHHSTRCCSTARSPALRSIAGRPRASTCAARARIPAAA